MESIVRLMGVLERVAPAIDEITDTNEMVMFLGTLIDGWTAKRGMTVEESKRMVDLLCEMHAKINNVLGVMA